MTDEAVPAGMTEGQDPAADSCGSAAASRHPLVASLALFALTAVAAMLDFGTQFSGDTLQAMFIRHDLMKAGPIAVVLGRLGILALTLFAIWMLNRQFRATGRSAAIGTILAAAILVMTAQTIGAAAGLYRLPLTLEYTAALAHTDDYALHYDEQTRTLALEGQIGFGLADAIRQMEATRGPIRTLEISSQGGLVVEALAIADIIRARRLKVVVRRICASACIVPAVASDEAYAEAGLRFGLHAPYDLAGSQSQIARKSLDQDRRDYRAFLLSRGVPEALLAAADGYAPDKLLTISAEALVDLGLLQGTVPRDR